MNSQLAPGSHRVVLLDVQKTFRRLPPFSGSVISLCPMSPLLLESEKQKKIEELIQSHKLDELVSTQQLVPLESQHLEGEGRHEKFKASLRYMEAILAT